MTLFKQNVYLFWGFSWQVEKFHSLLWWRQTSVLDLFTPVPLQPAPAKIVTCLAAMTIITFSYNSLLHRFIICKISKITERLRKFSRKLIKEQGRDNQHSSLRNKRADGINTCTSENFLVSTNKNFSCVYPSLCWCWWWWWWWCY